MTRKMPLNQQETKEWDLHDRAIRNDIASRGFHLGLVPALGETPGWAFSIGLREYLNHPDLICFGLDVAFVGGIVQSMAHQVSRGQIYSADEPVDGIISDHEIFLRSVDRKWTTPFLGNACFYYGREDITALQIFWPDEKSRFPWHKSFNSAWRDSQPFLYESETHRAIPDKLLNSLRQEGSL